MLVAAVRIPDYRVRYALAENSVGMFFQCSRSRMVAARVLAVKAASTQEESENKEWRA